MLTTFIIVCLIGIIISLSWMGYKNTKDVVINQLTIPEPGGKKGGVSLRVLHLSDLHLEHLSLSPEELYRYVKRLPVDLIAITGDFLDRKRTLKKLKPYLQVLGNLQPTYGAYAVFGNHDYILKSSDFTKLKELLEECGFQTLRNEHLTIDVHGKKVNIIGIDDYRTGHSDLDKAYRNVPVGYNLVLTHDPNIILEMDDYPCDFLLAGHFHSGQICWPEPYQLIKMPTMGRLPKLNMIKGLHRFAGKTFYISEGLGQTGLNIRFGSRPEITFHQIFLA